MYVDKKTGKLILDYNDRAIIQALMKNAKAPARVLYALMTNVKSKKQAYQSRLQQLKNLGVIKKRTIVVDPKFFGYQYKAILFVKLRKQEDVDVFIDTMKVLTPVRRCELVKGEYDYVIHVLVRNKEDYSAFLDYMIGLEMFAKFQSYDVSEEVIDKDQFPLY